MTPVTRPRRLPALTRSTAVAVVVLAALPLLSGCMTRSENVGDQFSGFVVVAATPDAGPAPAFDVPASLASSVSVADFPGEEATPGSPSRAPDEPETETSLTGKVGARLAYTDLTAGQFSQLGDIVSSALDAGATVDMSATRSGDIVRMRGGAALDGLSPKTYYVSITVDFAGPVVATNGHSIGDNSVTWAPEPGQNAQFNADVEYADPATAAVPSWTWFMVLVSLAIVAVVAGAAYRFRDRTPRYRPAAAEAAPNPLRGLTGALKGRKKSDGTTAADAPPTTATDPATRE